MDQTDADSQHLEDLLSNDLLRSEAFWVKIISHCLVPRGFTMDHWLPIHARLSALGIDDTLPDRLGYHGKLMMLAAGEDLITPDGLMAMAEDDDLLKACAEECVEWFCREMKQRGLDEFLPV